MTRHFLWSPLLATIGRSVGMLIPFFIAYFFGAGIETDAFFLAFGLINFLIIVFTQLFESVMVPQLVEQRSRSQKASDFANGVFFHILPAVALLCIGIGFALPRVLIHWSGWNEALAHRAAHLFMALTPFLFLGIWSTVGNGIFYAHQVFWFPNLSPLIRSVVVVIFIYALHHSLGIQALVIGYVAGEALRWMGGVSLLSCFSLWRFQVDWRRQRETIRSFLKKDLYQVFALGAISIIYFIDLAFASSLGEGNVSLVNYADRLLQVPYLFFQGGFLQVFHSLWSESYYEKPFKQVWRTLGRDVRIVFIVSLVFSLTAWFLRTFLIRLVFDHGGFSNEQLESLDSFFGWLVLGFAPGLVYLLYVRFLFILRESVFYLNLAWIHLIGKAILNLILMRLFGINGIAMATTVAYGSLSLALHYHVARISRKKMQ